ncbi:DUF4349 domain-containing protein [Radiobacillus deserti]|uniref:DUF4349 domain-containing protein n=1 Tax=Radiobacillus deserti TaxID=2594883 RepID=A0A516KCH0_9BACI|nr:DUF4349 domain-containing protein [Radiobacillus deserti]QDP39082.1 DUF4349 domain-containing protein [Radiobacillus deserti]
MWKRLGVLLLLLLVVIGCSNNEDSAEGDKSSSSEVESADTSTVEKAEVSKDSATEEVGTETNESETSPTPKTNRKIIYTANLELEVEDYQQSLTSIENNVLDAGGYIVESSSYREEEENFQGTITVRVPQEHFKDFLTTVEENGTKLLQKSVNGQDVTEEYVDLESRLASKQVVEKRLLQFMEQAEKTEDLLRISSDLAAVQEEIEQIKGRMKYLDNKSDLATVTIHLIEKRVNVPGIEQDSLNTWEKTKKQFMNSVNGLIAFGSGLFIFVVGNLPVLVLLVALGVGGYFVYRKVKKSNEHA